MPMVDVEGSESPAILLMFQRLAKFETAQGRLKGLDFQPGPRDVIITTSPKAGTTWMQQICHQLRSRGNMDFQEISEVVPWLELSYDQGQDLDAKQFGDEESELRFFKSHTWAKHCPNFPLTIVVIRDPCDVLCSFYHFFRGWVFDEGTISLETFARQFWLRRGVPDDSRLRNASYFVHLVSWFERRQDGNILFVCFEDLNADLEGQVERVAKFLAKLDPRYKDSERIRVAVSYSTYQFMKQHERQFDEKLSKLSRNEAMGLPKGAGMTSTKIRRGQSGVGVSEMTEELRQAIHAKWKEVVTPATGCATYQELREKLSQELKQGLIN